MFKLIKSLWKNKSGPYIQLILYNKKPMKHNESIRLIHFINIQATYNTKCYGMEHYTRDVHAYDYDNLTHMYMDIRRELFYYYSI